LVYILENHYNMTSPLFENALKFLQPTLSEQRREHVETILNILTELSQLRVSFLK